MHPKLINADLGLNPPASIEQLCRTLQLHCLVGSSGASVDRALTAHLLPLLSPVPSPARVVYTTCTPVSLRYCLSGNQPRTYDVDLAIELTEGCVSDRDTGGKVVLKKKKKSIPGPDITWIEFLISPLSWGSSLSLLALNCIITKIITVTYHTGLIWMLNELCKESHTLSKYF